MTYTSDVSLGSTEIFTAQERYFSDTLVLQYNNACFLLDTVTGTFQVMKNPGNINPTNFIWNDHAQTISINEWASATNTIQLYNSNICTPLGLKQMESISKFKLYPNPTNDILVIERDISQKEEMEILDIHGQLVKKAMLSTAETSIDISNLTPGVFFIRIGKAYQKIIKK